MFSFMNFFSQIKKIKSFKMYKQKIQTQKMGVGIEKLIFLKNQPPKMRSHLIPSSPSNVCQITECFLNVELYLEIKSYLWKTHLEKNYPEKKLVVMRWEEGCGDEWKRWKGLRSTNFQLKKIVTRIESTVAKGI